MKTAKSVFPSIHSQWAVVHPLDNEDDGTNLILNYKKLVLSEYQNSKSPRQFNSPPKIISLANPIVDVLWNMESQIRLNIEVEEATDRQPLWKIFGHLISNGIKFLRKYRSVDEVCRTEETSRMEIKIEQSQQYQMMMEDFGYNMKLMKAREMLSSAAESTRRSTYNRYVFQRGAIEDNEENIRSKYIKEWNNSSYALLELMEQLNRDYISGYESTYRKNMKELANQVSSNEVQNEAASVVQRQWRSYQSKSSKPDEKRMIVVPLRKYEPKSNVDAKHGTREIVIKTSPRYHQFFVDSKPPAHSPRPPSSNPTKVFSRPAATISSMS